MDRPRVDKTSAVAAAGHTATRQPACPVEPGRVSCGAAAGDAAPGLGRLPFSEHFEFENLTGEAGPMPVYEHEHGDLDACDPVEQIHVPRRDQIRARLVLWWRAFFTFWLDSLPHVAGHAPWILGIRSALVFLIPLGIGFATGQDMFYLQLAICGGALAMADPGGSFDRRGFTLLVTGLSCAALFALAQVVSGNAVATTVFIALTVFGVGFTPEFANPGIRGGFLAASVAIIGTAQEDAMMGMFSVAGFMYATPLVILLTSRLPTNDGTYQVIYQNLEESWRIRVFARHLVQHLLCRTAVSRHALRMAVASFMAVNFSELLGLGHPEWAAVASVVLLHPTAPTFRSRASALFTGTLLGCGVGAAVVMLADSWVVSLVLVCVALVLATPFRHVDYAAYVTMYSVFFIAALSLVTNDLASELGILRIADTLVGVGCSLLVLRFSMVESEHHALMEEIEYASRPRGEYAPLALFAVQDDRDATAATAHGVLTPDELSLEARRLQIEAGFARNDAMPPEQARAAAERVVTSGEARYRA